jgi:cell wall-associated NlpC family hydrolase
VAVVAGAVIAGLAGPPAVADRADPTYPSLGEVARSRTHEQQTTQRLAAIEAQLAGASSRLEQVATQTARAVEAYNGAVYRLRLARSAAAAAQHRYLRAAAAALEARADLGRLAATSYRSGGDLAVLAVVLDANGPRDLLDRASFLEYVGSYKQEVWRRSEAAQRRAAVLRAKADAALQAHRAAAHVVGQAKARAEAALAAQRQQHERIAVERAGLLTQLAAARRTTTALEQQRQAGIEAVRRAAEQARQAERARRAAQARRAAAAEARRAEQRRAAEAEAAAAARAAAGSARGRIRPSTRRSPTADPPVSRRARHLAGAAERAIAYALDQLGKPYEWAADGPDSFDCSGLTMRAWQAGGISLPHYSVAQYEQSTRIPLDEVRRGDLVFFAGDPGDHRTIYHVGLYIGAGRMIEAPYTGANVKISSIYRSSLLGAARPRRP